MKNDLTEVQLQTLREGLQGHHLEAMLLLAIVTGIRPFDAQLCESAHIRTTWKSANVT
jgi:hypothetical protein